LDGGLLESFGRLFKNQLQLLIYPMRDENGTGVRSLTEINIPSTMRPLFNYLNARGCIVPLSNTNHELLDIHSPDVLAAIASGESSWESKVPPSVAEAIKSKALFGYGGQT
ncbi:MAG: TonB-dependent receptor, partial [Pseudomonadota bacterium]